MTSHLLNIAAITCLACGLHPASTAACVAVTFAHFIAVIWLCLAFERRMRREGEPVAKVVRK